MTDAGAGERGRRRRTPYARLAELGLTLPEVVPPLAAYVPAVQSGNYVYVSGQLPMVDGKLPATGKVGAEVTAGAGRRAGPALRAERARGDRRAGRAGPARQDRQADRLRGLAPRASPASPPWSTAPRDLFGDVLGEQGRHARSAVGVAELPLGAPVEVEVIAEIAD